MAILAFSRLENVTSCVFIALLPLSLSVSKNVCQSRKILEKCVSNYENTVKSIQTVDSVAIGKPEWKVRKASHCGSKQQ